jgi:methionine biosynthesis protein MetW
MSTISAGRIDFAVIAGLVKPGTKVLDVGCGDGDLLDLLQRERRVDGRGIEISQKGVNECVARGLAVIQGDADSDLGFYQDKGFDYVILSQTLQATRNPRIVLEHLLRIGDRAIVSIPNFGHWRVRLSLFWTGRMPVTKDLPYTWYDTPNIHFCTIDDFIALCGEVGAIIESAAALNENGERMGLKLPRFLWNFFGQQAVFLVRK